MIKFLPQMVLAGEDGEAMEQTKMVVLETWPEGRSERTSKLTASKIYRSPEYTVDSALLS